MPEESIRQQVSVEKLIAAWQSVTAQVGTFKEQVGVHTFQIPAAELVIVTCAFAKASLDINVAFNDANEIVGLTITPVGSVEQQFTATYEPPAYVIQDMFGEIEVQIGQGEWVLPGTLSLPVGDGVQFKSYSGLHHLFMPVEGGGKATPFSYTVPGHVVEEVINDIAQWVKHC